MDAVVSFLAALGIIFFVVGCFALLGYWSIRGMVWLTDRLR